MKISGSKRKGQHTLKNNYDAENEFIHENSIVGEDEFPEKPKKGKRKKLPVILGVILGLVVIGGAYGYFYVHSALESPPPIRAGKMEPTYITPVEPSKPLLPGQPATNPGAAAVNDRISTIYTFLILASDDGNGNTDTIMVATFDTSDRTVEIVSIPRDTLANVSWYIKKVNTIYSSMRQQYGWNDSDLNAGMDATVEKLADIIGFMVDYWVIVDMDAFVTLIDAIDGVDFYVPINMNYDDFQAGLSIHYNQGMNHLYGKDALQVMRFRSGYTDQDIGRISTQQDFMLTAAEQILAKRNSISVGDFAKLFLRDVKSNLELSHLIWFGNEFMKLKADDINFHILPGNYWDFTETSWYVTIYVDEWLEIVNEYINPYQEKIQPEHVSILTRDSNGYLYVTDGNRQGSPSWGSSRGEPYRPASDTGNESASPAGQGKAAPPVTNSGQQAPSDPITQVAPGTNAAPPENTDTPDDYEPDEDGESLEGSQGLPGDEDDDLPPPEEGEETSPPDEPVEPTTEPIGEIQPTDSPPADPEE